MAVGCSDGAAEVSSGTVWHDRRVVSAPPVELRSRRLPLRRHRHRRLAGGGVHGLRVSDPVAAGHCAAHSRAHDGTRAGRARRSIGCRGHRITSAAQILGPKWSGLIAAFRSPACPSSESCHFHYGVATIEPMVKVWPAGAFGICLFNLGAWLTLERFGIVGSLASATPWISLISSR